MGDHHGQLGQGHIGEYLRSVRESRRLSLEAVEEMTGPLPGSVTKSYLSRMENGHLEPTFPRLYALSQVYGVPIASIAERFEIDLRRRTVAQDGEAQPTIDLLAQLERLYHAGCYVDVLSRVELLLDRAQRHPLDEIEVQRLRMWRISCLIYLDRVRTAKEDCEDLLSERDLDPRYRAFALYHFARCCHHLGKLPLALMALGTLENELPSIDDPGLSVGNLVSLKGLVLTALDCPGDALDAFRQAIAHFEAADDALSTCRHRINYATVLADTGKSREARRHLTKALAQARGNGFVRQTAFAVHGLGKVSFQLDELKSAESHFIESNRISRQQDYVSLIFCNCYYLWRIARSREDAPLAAAHQRSMRAYVSRVPETLPEARAFRSQETGGAA